MHDAPRYDPLEASTVLPKGSSAQPLVAGTVPRGFLNEDVLYTTGIDETAPAAEFPFPITKADLDRGQEEFNAFCSPCHGRTGYGDGMVIQRGFQRQPPSYHQDRLRNPASPQARPGYFVNVMTKGFGVMSDYSAQVSIDDRWRIAAYIKALQLSQNATGADIPADEMRKLEAPPAPAAAPKKEGN